MKSLAPIAVILAIVLLLLGSYVGAYLGMGYLGEHVDALGRTILYERRYSHQWAMTVFAPAAWAESKMRGHEVRVLSAYPDDHFR